MNPWAEIKGYVNILADRLTEHYRHKAPEPRFWLMTYAAGQDLLIEKTGSAEISRLAVEIGLAESKTGSDRLIKQNGMEIRPWDCHSWWRKVKPKEALEPGVPVLLRRGKAYYGIKTVMVPLPTQSIRFWRQWLRNS